MPNFRDDHGVGDFVDECCRNIGLWTNNPKPIHEYDSWPVHEILALADDLIRISEERNRG